MLTDLSLPLSRGHSPQSAYLSGQSSSRSAVAIELATGPFKRYFRIILIRNVFIAAMKT